MRMFDITNPRQMLAIFQRVLFFFCLYIAIVKALENCAKSQGQWYGRTGQDNADIDNDACLPFCKEEQFAATIKLLAEGAYDAMSWMKPIFKVLAQQALNYCAQNISIPNSDFSPCAEGTGATTKDIEDYATLVAVRSMSNCR